MLPTTLSTIFQSNRDADLTDLVIKTHPDPSLAGGRLAGPPIGP